MKTKFSYPKMSLKKLRKQKTEITTKRNRKAQKLNGYTIRSGKKKKKRTVHKQE